MADFRVCRSIKDNSINRNLVTGRPISRLNKDPHRNSSGIGALHHIEGNKLSIFRPVGIQGTSLKLYFSKMEPINCRAFLEPINCRVLLEPLSCRSGKLMVQVTKLWLEPILCRDWNQLIAASSIKTERLRISTLSTIRVLEPLNCRECKLEAKPCRKCKVESNYMNPISSLLRSGISSRITEWSNP